MDATATLPRFCIIKSNYNDRYLQLHTTSDVPNIALQFGGGNIFDLSARFEMVPATTVSGLYHIKSMKTSKYLAHLGDGHMWITAIAAAPDEDRNSKTCTLFKPVLVNPGGYDNKTIRLRHVKTGCYACLWRVGPPFNECLYTAVPTVDGSGCDVYTIIDHEAAVDARIAGLNESLASERADKKALGGRFAALEAEVANLKNRETKLTGDKKALEEKLAAVDARIAGLNASLATERADKKALGERFAALEAEIANLKNKETKLTEDKKALEEKVSELASKLEKCCGCSKDGSANKNPWMSDTVFPSYFVPFEDLDVLQVFASKSTLITITEVSGEPPDLVEDDTTNVRTYHFKRGMLDGQLVCVVVNVAGLLPNNEMARFNPDVWGLFNKSGTSYAARKATSSDC